MDEGKANIAKMAKVNRLTPYADLSMLDNYAKAYGMSPNEVYNKEDFDTVIAISVMWKEQAEYNERKADIERMMTSSTTQGT